jgi:hypothetical protein
MAVFAISLLDICSTAIPTIVLATTIVVVVVTEAVTDQAVITTLAVARLLFLRVNARTVFAVRRYDFF